MGDAGYKYTRCILSIYLQHTVNETSLKSKKTTIVNHMSRTCLCCRCVLESRLLYAGGGSSVMAPGSGVAVSRYGGGGELYAMLEGARIG